MVGLVLVSHSRKLAEAVRELVQQTTNSGFPVAVAAGAGDHHEQLGTDVVQIANVLQKLACPEGVLVLMDMGSAVLSAETALELQDLSELGPIRLCPAPLVEGAFAAAASAQAGGTLAEVAREAELSLVAKQQQLRSENAVKMAPAQSRGTTCSSEETEELVLTIETQHGLHARPAAALVQAISPFSSAIEISNLTSGRGPIPARSLTSLALLQVQKGDRIKVVSRGADCQAALEVIRALAAAGFGEQANAVTDPRLEMANGTSGARGLPASDGIAVGPLAMIEEWEGLGDDRPAGEPTTEVAKLIAAMRAVSEQVLCEGMEDSSGSPQRGAPILKAQALLLSDPVLLTNLKSRIETGRLSATRAWVETTRELAGQYQAMDDPYLRERAADVGDIARRVLREIQGGESHVEIRLDHPAILFTDELLPGTATVCDPAVVLGVITGKGSAMSHSAIILRTLGIPMVVGAAGIDKAALGQTVAMDGSTGEVWINPDTQTAAALTKRKEDQMARRQLTEAARSQPSFTLDGTCMEVLANVGNLRESEVAAENGADGVGLLRTEFLFVSRAQAPSEEEQTRALREIYASVIGPITVRTLDVGAEKSMPFLPQSKEHNPYLGVRGIRLSLQSPNLFLPHLRAILRSGVGHEVWLMFPMISVRLEVREALSQLDQAHRELASRGIPHLWPIKRGAMIEVPSAALMTGQLAEDFDFFSIGTNDLTQYTMAADRSNTAMANLQDALHPAVLRLMKSAVDGAQKGKRHLSVCGDAAADPLSAAIFAGLGIRSLSVRPNRIAHVKALFRKVQLADLARIASRALRCQDAAGVRRLIMGYLNNVASP